MQDEPNSQVSREELERGLGVQRAKEFDGLKERAESFGGRLRVERRSPATSGRGRFVFVVDLDPKGPHRLRFGDETAKAHHLLEDAVQHVAELERRYGAAGAS